MKKRSVEWKIFILFVICFDLYLPMAAFAQVKMGNSILVRGIVSNASGERVPGATILEEHTNNGTFSNAKGEFSIVIRNIPNTLIVSMVGYAAQKVSVKDDKPLELILQATSGELNEVVVVGYGQQKRINLTGAVASISSRELENRPVTNVGQALQGRVANLNIRATSSGGAPNAQPSINIRGYTGIGTSVGPLIVIDGIPGGDLNSLNPADIESISVLKDAAAGAIYGSQAPYGVMLVTTKQGKKDRKPSISYSNNFSFSQVINLPKMVNSLDFANIFNEAFVNAGRPAWFDNETLQRIRNYIDGKLKDETIKDPNQDDWFGSGNGYFTGAGPQKGNGNNDWFKIFFKPWAFSQQHNLGISGGGNSSTYYLGAGYLNKGGMYNFGSDKFKRFNLRTNISTNLSKWLTVNFRSALSKEINNTPATYNEATGGNYMHQISRKLPNTPLKNPDGYYSDYSNINLFTEGGRYASTDNRAILTGEVILRPTDGWNITGNFTYDGRYFNDENFNKIVYSILPSGKKVVQFQTNPNNSLTKFSSVNDHFVMNLFTSYEKQISEHHFQVLGGYIKDYRVFKSLSAGNSSLYSNDLPSLNLTYNASPSIGDNYIRLAIEGFFGRLNYSYQEKYLFELNGRYDASSRFLQQKRWNFYPSVSAGYVISNEKFWQPLVNAINSFKIRGSYGSLGDQWGDNPDQNNYYPFYPSLGTVAPNGTNWIFSDGRQAYINPPGLINQQLTWATIKSLNLGVDADFMNRRLSVSFDWYKRNAEDFVGPAEALPAVLGAAVPPANNASMQTTGFELTLAWNDKIGSIKYYARGVLSNYKGKVLKYPNPAKLSSDWYPGKVMGEIWGYVTDGLFQTSEQVNKAPKQNKIFGGNWTPGDIQYKDLNGDGLVDFGNNTVDNPGDRKVIGNNTPQYSYGFTLGAQWRGFDISVFLQGVAKRDVWIGSNMYWGIVGVNAQPEWQSTVLLQNLNRWTPQTPDGFFPKYYMSQEMNKNMQVQTKYLQNAAYMRIKNIQLGYNLPNNIIGRTGLKSLRIYMSTDNLATFTKLQKSIDPEAAISDGKIYPLQRTVSFGLNVTL